MKDYYLSFLLLAAILIGYSVLVVSQPKPTHNSSHDTPMASTNTPNEKPPLEDENVKFRR